MKKNILLSGILLLSFSCAVAQDYHDDVVVLDSVKVMSFNIRFNNPNDSLDTSWDRRREPCARMMAQYRPTWWGCRNHATRCGNKSLICYLITVIIV